MPKVNYPKMWDVLPEAAQAVLRHAFDVKLRLDELKLDEDMLNQAYGDKRGAEYGGHWDGPQSMQADLQKFTDLILTLDRQYQ